MTFNKYLAKNDVSVFECIPVKIELQKRNKNVSHVQKTSFVFLST